MPSSLATVEAYWACRSQWQYAGTGVRTGLSYPGVTSALAALYPHASAARLRRLFEGVCTIEHALLTAQREAFEAEHGKGPADE